MIILIMLPLRFGYMQNKFWKIVIEAKVSVYVYLLKTRKKFYWAEGLNIFFNTQKIGFS